jgi:hypothetical protein
MEAEPRRDGEPTRLDLEAELTRLDTLVRVLQEQRSQVVFRLGRLERERERVLRHLEVLDGKGEEGSSA